MSKVLYSEAISALADDIQNQARRVVNASPAGFRRVSETAYNCLLSVSIAVRNEWIDELAEVLAEFIADRTELEKT